MMLPHAARRAAGAAGVDDAGEVVAPDPAHRAHRARDVRPRPPSARPSGGSCPSRALAGADVLDADDVVALAEEHGREQVLRQLLVRDDHRSRARIAEDVRVIAFGVGDVGRHRDAARGHDTEIGDQPFRPVLATSVTRSPGLSPSASGWREAATWRAASAQLIERHCPSRLSQRNGASPSPRRVRNSETRLSNRSSCRPRFPLIPVSSDAFAARIGAHRPTDHSPTRSRWP